MQYDFLPPQNDATLHTSPFDSRAQAWPWPQTLQCWAFWSWLFQRLWCYFEFYNMTTYRTQLLQRSVGAERLAAAPWYGRRMITDIAFSILSNTRITLMANAWWPTASYYRAPRNLTAARHSPTLYTDTETGKNVKTIRSRVFQWNVYTVWTAKNSHHNGYTNIFTPNTVLRCGWCWDHPVHKSGKLYSLIDIVTDVYLGCAVKSYNRVILYLDELYF